MILSGIYRIQSKARPDRIYIGSAVYIHDRWYGHRHKLRKNKHENSKLQNHYNKYGEDDFIFDILFLCDVNELVSAEQFLIDSYNPWFNICKVAGSQLGNKWAGRGKQRKPRTQEHKDNLSKSRKGKPSPLKGIKLTQEHIEKVKIGTKLAMQNPELRKRLSDKKKGVKPWITGKHQTPEAIEKTVAGKRKQILQFDKNNVFIKEWPSINQAARELYLLSGNISKCAKHKVRSVGGFLWEYKIKETQAV